MLEHYEIYMSETFPQDPNAQWLKCLEFSTKMNAQFPELTLRKGYVYSLENEDNSSENYSKQYPHAWLTSPTGELLDPTVLQFCLLGKLEYVETEHLQFKCMGCGQFQPADTEYCGTCEYSE